MGSLFYLFKYLSSDMSPMVSCLLLVLVTVVHSDIADPQGLKDAIDNCDWLGVKNLSPRREEGLKDAIDNCDFLSVNNRRPRRLEGPEADIEDIANILNVNNLRPKIDCNNNVNLQLEIP